MVKEFMGVDLTDVRPIDASEELNKKPGSLYIVSLASILSWIMDGKVVPYPHNRGTGKVALTTYKRILADGVQPDVIGECTFGIFDNNGESQLCLNNWHSRAKAFLKRYVDGDLSSKELRTLVSVRVQSEFIKSYQRMNAPGSAHRSKDKICNPDLAYGIHLSKVFDRIGDECVNLIGENRWTVLSAILYNLGKDEIPDWKWPQVYRLRTVARIEADKLAGQFRVANKNIESLVAAIQFWYELMNRIQLENATKIKLDKIIGSAGFFGYVLCDRLGGQQMHPTIKINSNRIFSNYGKILPALPELCRGNADTLQHFTAELDKVFKKVNRLGDAA